MSHKATPVRRGCGERVEGGVYLECGVGAGGMPIEYFMCCPPRRIGDLAASLSARGVQVIRDPSTGIYHVYDMVGANNYPNVADYIAETRYFGASRRTSPDAPLHLLTPESQLRLIHSRGYIENFIDYWYASEADKHCPKQNPDHETSDAPLEMCASLYWQDIEGGSHTDVAPRHVTRRLPSVDYQGFARPEGIEPSYSPAIFMVLPLHRIVVIQGGKHDENKAKLEKNGAVLPVESEER